MCGSISRTGGCTIAATVIAGTVAAVIGAKIQGRKRAEEKLRQAVTDIHFLLEVEQRHVDHNLKQGRSGWRNVVRGEVRAETGLQWSGLFTPGRAQRQFDQLEQAVRSKR